MSITRLPHQASPWPSARVDVLDRLGFAGRARRVHPERDFVRQRRRGDEFRLGLPQYVLEIEHVPQLRPILGAGADHDDRAQAWQTIADRHHRARQRSRDHGGRGAAVRKQIGVLLRGQQRVDRNGNDAGADRPPEGDGMIHAVVAQEDEPVLLAQPQRLQCIRKTPGACLQCPISQRALGVGECDLVAEASCDIAVDEIGGGVVRPTLQYVFKHWRKSQAALI